MFSKVKKPMFEKQSLKFKKWIPACAGMTTKRDKRNCQLHLDSRLKMTVIEQNANFKGRLKPIFQTTSIKDYLSNTRN
ncbi:hypothetical protein NEIMUCOT_04463 [Neisseria mucosa ATCC 25996]|uniref:Uncharacterized protein n=1 Tax=Neisseria mucosa (strain ATCC 25996 / DSM 4631 / NCTC 10774 / M26) TaxID=546266 RepID=D2ZV22_NEIM2|nr:hypothetical protein NEIMUCOT_04463 [Neisseria mucosa ATCC 25996]SUA38102.1 Uncharacterised protein [Neisseria mucosa]